MVEDISNRTILILVALTIIVSTLGTLTVMDSVGKYNAAAAADSQEGSTTSVGKVSLYIPKSAPSGEVNLFIPPSEEVPLE
ncbi:hypothetical protein K9M74_05440 [Candidatus Woesearchaeota archaeon]|nr:hypothetical protein [Candidatus Woesearchaeota archaeon]